MDRDVTYISSDFSNMSAIPPNFTPANNRFKVSFSDDISSTPQPVLVHRRTNTKHLFTPNTPASVRNDSTAATMEDKMAIESDSDDSLVNNEIIPQINNQTLNGNEEISDGEFESAVYAPSSIFDQDILTTGDGTGSIDSVQNMTSIGPAAIRSATPAINRERPKQFTMPYTPGNTTTKEFHDNISSECDDLIRSLDTADMNEQQQQQQQETPSTTELVALEPLSPEVTSESQQSSRLAALVDFAATEAPEPDPYAVKEVNGIRKVKPHGTVANDSKKVKEDLELRETVSGSRYLFRRIKKDPPTNSTSS
ncbi:hypothetical protein GQ42DRAFT_55255 [Ramicandelaber brevisporus]|nr:hypothetical protein GQ42DRAFT_55255 [Ramicandelaber brevisporus]